MGPLDSSISKPEKPIKTKPTNQTHLTQNNNQFGERRETEREENGRWWWW
jgi:hypothetical protein